MKALMRLTPKAGDVALCNIPEPAVERDDWVKIKVYYAGVCASDIKMMDQYAYSPNAKLKPPVVLGHESSGVVVEIGPKVHNVSVGDRVVYETTIDNCGACRYCLSGDWNMCAHRKGVGSSTNGGFAEYITVPARNLHIIPAHVSLKTAAIVEPLGCAVHIVQEVAQVKFDDKVVVFGPGTIGLCCGLVAKANGAHVCMVGTNHSRHRLGMARRWGFDTLINDVPDFAKSIYELFGGKLADVAIDAAGSQGSFDQAVHSVRKMGCVTIGAVSGSEGYMKLDLVHLYRNQIQICCGASTKPSSWRTAMLILSSYSQKLEKLCSHCFPIEQWESAFDMTRRREGFKTMIVLENEQ